MKLAPVDLERCRELVSQSLHELAARFHGVDASDVVGPLARCANRLNDDPPAPPEEIALLIRTTVSAGMSRVARGQLEWAQLEALAEAHNAALRRPAEESALLGFAPPVESTASRRAIWAPPGRLRLWEARVAMPQQLKEAKSADGEKARTEHRDGLLEETAADEAELDADNLAPPASAELDAAPAGTDAAASAESEGPTSTELYDPEIKPPPPVRFDPELAPIVPLFRHYALVAEQALDTLALLNLHRLDRTMGEAQDEELRICKLLDAAITTGPDLVENAEHWWAQNLDSPDEWKVWAPCYVLGSLEDERAPLAIDRVLDDLDPEMTEQVVAAAQGLHLARGSSRPLLLRELRGSPNPFKRAVGVRAASFCAELAPADIAHHLGDPSPVVIEAALDAAGRLSQLPVVEQDRLVPFLHSGVPRFVGAATKALLLHGRPEPSMELDHGKLETALGPRLLECLVWMGNEHDVPRLERFVQGRELSGAQLVQVGLFGHPAMWSFLAHFLADEDLQEDAVYALTLLFGVGVDDDHRFERGAWEAQLAHVGPDARMRYRLGKPFSVSSVQEEYQLRRVSYRALEGRLDEMAIRTGTRVDTPLHGWTADSEGKLQTQLMKLHQVGSTIRPGTWDGNGRR